MKNVSVLGYNIFDDSFEVIKDINSQIIINTISPNSFSIAHKNALFKRALKSSDIITLDGLYFGLAPKLLKGISVRKKSGTDWFYYLMNYYNEKGGKIFFLGSQQETLNKIILNAREKYPNLSVQVFSPPFKESFAQEDVAQMTEAVSQFNPDVLFIGLTAPKQEILAYQLRHKVNAKIICTIGNVFDWFAGSQKQPEKIWVKLGLEWLIRTVRRPEMLKRYPNVFYFFWLLFLNLIKVRKD